IVFTLLGMTLVGCQPGVSPILAATCSSKFEATVYQGPSAGTKLTGDFDMRISSIDEGTALVHRADNNDIQVSGQGNRQSINLVFNVGDQQYLSGSGAGELPIYECAGVWGGGFTGPQGGDSGDWIVRGGQIGNGDLPPITEFKCGEGLGNLCMCKGAADCAD